MGAYHLAYPNVNSAIDEAEFFLSIAGSYISEGYLRPVLDLEYGQSLTTEALSAWIHEFMDVIENATNVVPVIYTTKSYAQYELDDSVAQYDLWIAHWQCSIDNPPSTADLGIWDTWAFWQYWEPEPENCGPNTVPGISVPVDLDVFNGDTNELYDYVIGSSQPTITSSLTISPQKTSYAPGETITAAFTITNQGTVATTFDELVAGGRGPQNEVVDFASVHNITLEPDVSYHYSGTLTLPSATGDYNFFCAYYIADPSPSEAVFLDVNNWNTNIQTGANVVNSCTLTVSSPDLKVSLPSDWNTNQLFIPVYRRSGTTDGSVLLGAFNRRDMWYETKVYRRSDTSAWEDVTGTYMPGGFLHPNGQRVFNYIPQAGEQIKITVRNYLENDSLRALWTFDFITRALLGVSISPEVTDPEELTVEVLTFYNDYLNIGAHIVSGQWSQAFSSACESLLDDAVRQVYVSILTKLGIQTPSSSLVFRANLIVAAMKLAGNTGAWANLIKYTNVGPWETEEIVYTVTAPEPPATPQLEITAPLELDRMQPYFTGQTVTASFTLKNSGTASISLATVSVQGTGPRGESDFVTFTPITSIELNSSSQINYSGTLLLPDEGDYRFFAACQTTDGQWNTDIDAHQTLSQDAGTKDINVLPMPFPETAEEVEDIEDPYDTDVSPPVVSVGNPTGGERWQTGTVHTILWHAADTVGVMWIDIYFSTDNWENSSTKLARLAPSSSSYSWTVPDTPTSLASIKIITSDAAGNISVVQSGIFTISTDNPQPDLTVSAMQVTDTNPMAGETVTVTTTAYNQGTGPSSATNIRYYLSGSPTGMDYYLGESTLPALSSGGSYAAETTVTIPETQSEDLYMVAILDAGQTVNETSESNNTGSITISLYYVDDEPPVITYLTIQWGGGPEANILKRGYEYNIVFSVTDNDGVDNLDFFYSTDDGQTWQTIVTGFIIGSNNIGNAYNWTVPADASLSTGVRIKMTARDYHGLEASAVSTITYSVIDGSAPDITVLSPEEGDIWDLGSQHDICWEASSPNGITAITIYLYYSDDSEYLIQLTGNTGSWSWTLPSSSHFISTSCKIKIRVEDGNGNINQAWSDGFFTMRDAASPPALPWTTPERVTFITPGNVSFISEDNENAVVVVDDAGTVHLAYRYVEDDMSAIINDTGPRVYTQTIFYRQLQGSVWSAPEQVYTLTQECELNMSGCSFISSLKMTVDHNNRPHLIWVFGPHGFGDILYYNMDEIYYSSRNDSSWSSPVNLSNNSTVSSLPDIAAGADNTVYAVWRDGYSWHSDMTTTGDFAIYLSKKPSESESWTTPVALASDWCSWPAVAADATGTIMVVYQTDCYIDYVIGDGTNWSSPMRAVGSGDHYNLDLVMDGSGNAHLTWYWPGSDENNTFWQRIYYTSYNGMTWSSPEEVTRRISGCLPENPYIVVTSSGIPHIIYADSSDGSAYHVLRTGSEWSNRMKVNADSQYVTYAPIDISPNNVASVVWTCGYDGHQEVFYNHADISQDVYPPLVNVTAPVADDTLAINTVCDIRWTALDSSSIVATTVKYATQDDMSDAVLVTDGLTDETLYSWTVPAITAESIFIIVTVTDIYGNIGTGISGSFSIADTAAPSVTLLSPDGGTQLQAGTAYTITWLAQDNIAVTSIDLYYSLDNGLVWKPISNTLSNTGSYTWTVPNCVSSCALVKVVARDAANNQADDTCDSVCQVVCGNKSPVFTGTATPADGDMEVQVSVSLFWQCTDADTGDTLTYDVYFGNTTELTLVSASQSANSYNPGVLTYNTYYFWQIRATDSTGHTSCSSLWTFHTVPEPVPAAPATLTCTESQEPYRVQLEWQDLSSNENGFKISKQMEGQSGFYLIAIVDSDETDFTDSRANEDTSGTYQICAFNDTGNSAYIFSAQPSQPSSGGGGGGGGGPGLLPLPDRTDVNGALYVDVRLATIDHGVILLFPAGTSCTMYGYPAAWLGCFPLGENEEPPPLPENHTYYSTAYQFKPEGIEFSQPIACNFAFNPDELPEGCDASSLRVMWWDPENEEWVPIESEIDLDNGYIRAYITHFSLYALMLDARQPDISVSNVAISSAEIYVGEDISVTVTLVNQGTKAGDTEIALNVNGAVVGTQTVTVTENGEATVSFTLDELMVGSHDIEIARKEYTVIVMPVPAAFECSNLSITPEEADIGQDVNVTVTVTNTGGSAGRYTVEFRSNMVTFDIRELELESGAIQEISSTTSFTEAGKQLLEVNSLLGTVVITGDVPKPEHQPILLEETTPAVVTEEEPASPSGLNWLVIGITGGGGILIITAIIIAVLRRRK